jgi:hypothetical protein
LARVASQAARIVSCPSSPFRQTAIDTIVDGTNLEGVRPDPTPIAHVRDSLARAKPGPLELAVCGLLSVIDGDYVSRYILSLRKS